jgi:DNA ligase (NAD+)
VGLSHRPDEPALRESQRSCRLPPELEAKRDELDYELDGIVVKVDRRDQQAELGSRSRSPRWAVAFKFAAARK